MLAIPGFPGFIANSYATDCRPPIGGKVPIPPKKNWPWFHGLLFGMRFRVTATQWLRRCAAVSRNRSFGGSQETLGRGVNTRQSVAYRFLVSRS